MLTQEDYKKFLNKDLEMDKANWVDNEQDIKKE